MTPAARLSAAIGVLDRYLGGTPVEQALTNWGRASRYAGSGDRQAVRDLVFDAVRCRRSFAALGGAETGRGLILGGLRAGGQQGDDLFCGVGHAPAVLTEDERRPAPDMTEAVRLDCPDWLMEDLRDALGADLSAVLQALQHRAPVFVRVNLARISVADAAARLAGEGIMTRPCALADTALEVTENARKIATSAVYIEGLIELQDAASQAVVQALPLRDGMRVLDYCAGGGGKSLAMAARAQQIITAHDANPARLRDLPARATRAGVRIKTVETKALSGLAPFDLVLADAPCSGSGAWRRAPEGKWSLTQHRLQELCALQISILDQAARLVRKDGYLAFVTCSMLTCENGDQAAQFVDRHPNFSLETARQYTPLDGGDGFFFAVFARKM